MNKIGVHIRLKHWVKNLLIFIPAVFGLAIHDQWFVLCIAALSFSLMASAVYIFNDIADRQWDSNNPTKEDVIHAHQIKPYLLVESLLALISLAISFVFLPLLATATIFAYLLINLVYSLGAKNIPYFEMCFVILGFLLRILLGSIVSSTPISNWLWIEVTLISGCIIVFKRLKEIRLFHQGIHIRKVVSTYQEKYFRNLFTALMLGVIIVYTLYCLFYSIVELPFHLPFMTLIPVLYGAFYLSKYIYGNVIPDKNPVYLFLSDSILIGCALVWISMWIYLLYAY